VKDIPSQYKPLIKDRCQSILSSSKDIMAVVGELGCNTYTMRSNGLLITIQQLPKREDPPHPDQSEGS
jgi:hypothetical protein